MIDTETRVHNAIKVLAAAEPVSTPLVGTVLERRSRAARPRRSRALILAVTAAGLILVSAAGATGRLPGSVEGAFHRISGWSHACRVDDSRAKMVASARVPDGRTIEWWRAAGPRAVGDDFRAVKPGESSHSMAWACTVDHYPPGKLLLGGTSDGNADGVSWGEAPVGAQSVRAVYRDGVTAVVALQHGRYFMANLDRSVAPHDPPVRIEALRPDGTVIDSVPVP